MWIRGSGAIAEDNEAYLLVRLLLAISTNHALALGVNLGHLRTPQSQEAHVDGDMIELGHRRDATNLLD